MTAAVMAQKLGMTHIYDEKHRHIPVTILKVPTQVITAIRTNEKDAYAAIQIGAVISKRMPKPQAEELKKHNIDATISHRFESRSMPADQATIGAPISVTSFTPGDVVVVTGTSKGKGFSGGIKRYGWSRGPMSHGSKHHRAPGSIGSGYPQRVVPGKKLPGHMGHETVTVHGHHVVAINETDATIAISGALPGANKSHLIIQKV